MSGSLNIGNHQHWQS